MVLNMKFIRILCIIAAALTTAGIFSSCNTDKKSSTASDVETSFKLGGFVGKRFEMNEKNWLEKALDNNPSMVDYFDSRDTDPHPVVPWYGEFPGKYMTACALSYKMSRSASLKQAGDKMIDRLAKAQGDDGYIGPYTKSQRMIGTVGSGLQGFDPTSSLWDVWGHYHIIYGTYQWYKATGSQKALNIAVKAADYVYNFFIGGNVSFLKSGSSEMNLAISHAFAILYEETKNQKYLAAAKKIVNEDWKDVDVGDWKGSALDGTDFFVMRNPRWESLHDIMTLSELYKIDKDKDDYTAVENIWWSIIKTDRHNTGAFSSKEQAIGSPYSQEAIETCCNIAWMALSTDYLKMSHNSYVADELELSELNGFLGSQINNGTSYTYNTPMAGTKIASQITLKWQGVSGGSDLNCCQMNGGRGFGQIGEWGVVSDDTGFYLNYYGESQITSVTPKGNRIMLTQETNYPVNGNIKIKINLDKSEKMNFNLRVPVWSQNTIIKLNGKQLSNVKAGQYYSINRKFKNNDVIELALDVGVHYWAGENEEENKTSVYWGPILLALDTELSGGAATTDSAIDNNSVKNMKPVLASDNNSWITAEVKTTSGDTAKLVDFASAGQNGQRYTTWLNMNGIKTIEFQKDGLPVWANKG